VGDLLPANDLLQTLEKRVLNLPLVPQRRRAPGPLPVLLVSPPRLA
jgi:hypothetical protein